MSLICTALGSFQQKLYKTTNFGGFFLTLLLWFLLILAFSTTGMCALPSSLSYMFLEQLTTLNTKSCSLFCSLLLCHACVICSMVGKQGAWVWASSGLTTNYFYVTRFMVSAFIQKTGKAMALLPVLNLEIAEVTVLYAEGRVCVYFKMCSKLTYGWEPWNWSSLCVGLECAICNWNLCLGEDDGFCAWRIL